MNIVGKLRCWFRGCNERHVHQLDADFVLYVCKHCGKSDLEGPASDFDRWSGWFPKGWKWTLHGNDTIGVWWDDKRRQMRTWL